MIRHTFTCGCVMTEGHPASRHPSGDYRDVSCDRHVALASFVWPHHVDPTTTRIPPPGEVLGEQLVEDLLRRWGWSR